MCRLGEGISRRREGIFRLQAGEEVKSHSHDSAFVRFGIGLRSPTGLEPGVVPIVNVNGMAAHLTDLDAIKASGIALLHEAVAEGIGRTGLA